MTEEVREVMNIQQASKYLGISRDSLYKYAMNGNIPSFKLGNRWRFKKTVVDEWMSRKTSEMEFVLNGVERIQKMVQKEPSKYRNGALADIKKMVVVLKDIVGNNKKLVKVNTTR